MNQHINLYQQRILQLYLICIASREETIFHLRIIAHQIQLESVRKNIRVIIDESQKGEEKRSKLEQYSIDQFSEPMRKYLIKISQKVNKIQTYYLNKIQVKTYFPRQGQILAHEQIQQNLSLKQAMSLLIADPINGCDIILNHISNHQKQRLKSELTRFQIQLPSQQDRCNRNEKFFTEPLIQGVIGIQYLNDLHQKYYFCSPFRFNRFVYDILPMDEYSKSLLMNGLGFKSFISTVSQIDKTQLSFYTPIESTTEIITQRYEKLLKDLQDNNQHISKALQQYYENYTARQQNQNNSSIVKRRNQTENSYLQTTSRTYHSISQTIFRPRDTSSTSNLNTQNIIYQPNNSRYIRPSVSQAVKSRKERENNDSFQDQSILQAKFPQFEFFRSALTKRKVQTSGYIQPPMLAIQKLGHSYLLHGISIMSSGRKKLEDESIRYSQSGNVFRVQRTSQSVSAIRGK